VTLDLPAARPVRGSTQVAGIIGWPVRHSLSPVIQNAAFAACDLDVVYLAFPVPAGQAGAALDAARLFGLLGLSVTMPHKSGVAGLVDHRSPTVAALGAANTVTFRNDGSTAGESTDGGGFLDSLRLDHGIEPAGLAVAVLGAGGAARSVVRSLAEAGCREIVVVNRTASAAEAAVALAPRVARGGRTRDVTDADLIVHATPLGMGDSTELPIDAALLRPGQVVADLVYHPRRTPLLLAASERGCRIVDGLGMLVHQGARQFTLWTGVEAPREIMRAAAEAALAGT
jgi:shikimate dehydrogenase